MSASCYLCVERPPPSDLRSHLLYHHLIENDEALPSIISLSRKENIETQTTVTWVNEFEYFDNRKKQNNDKNGHFEEQEIQKSNNSIAKFQRHKIIQSSKRNRRYPNHIPPIHLTQKRRLTERKSSSHEHFQKDLEDCLIKTDQEQNMDFLSHDDKHGGSKETASNSELNSNENMEIDNKMTEKKHLNQGDNICQLDFNKDVVRESNISSTQSRENSNCYYEDFENGDDSNHKDSKAFTTVRVGDDDMNSSAVSIIEKLEVVPHEIKVTVAQDLIEENNTPSIQAPLEDRNVTSELPEVAKEFEKQSILKNLMSQGSLSIIKPSGEDGSNILLNDDKHEDGISRKEVVSMKINNLGTSISITRIPSIVEKTEIKMDSAKFNETCSLGEADLDKAFHSDEESEEESE